MNPAILSLLNRYQCVTGKDYENALKETIQQIALLGLWRGKFFEHAAFYGGTALRILYGLDRFSEDLDFSLLHSNQNFKLAPYLQSIGVELNAMGFHVTVTEKEKIVHTAIESTFIKAGTQEHLFKVQVPDFISERVQKNAVMSIKLEVDVDPPSGFETEAKMVLLPIPFWVNTYKKPDLFAGKLHAILQRNWKNRVKGRDYYDYFWYVAHEVPVNLKHLENRLRQSGGWNRGQTFQRSDLIALLKKKFSEVDFESAKKDVQPFLRDSAAVDLWSQEFFESLLTKLKVIEVPQ